MEHADLEVIKGLVAAGLGLSILPASSVRGETRRGELSAWPLVDLPVGIEVLLLTDPKRGSWDITNALIESLQKYGKNTP
jgi:DNA-binding transcriptional LysR family regulator